MVQPGWTKATKQTDDRHRLLLRAGGERHRNRCASGKSDELPPDHSITCSASDGGPALIRFVRPT
jgi:hypothetical protein